MKKLFYLFLVMGTVILPVLSQEPSLKTQNTQVSEQKWVDEILQDYQGGKHHYFLEQIHRQYEESLKKWAFNAPLEERKKLSMIPRGDAQKTPDLFTQKTRALHKTQDQELIAVCLDHPHLKRSAEVKEMVLFAPTQLEQNSLDYILELSHKFKGDGKTPLENRLIAIDTEFFLKLLIVDKSLVENKIHRETFDKQRLLLHLEKLKHMQTACLKQKGQKEDRKEDQKEDQESIGDIKTHIETAYAICPQVQASALTRRYLTALGREKIQPQNTCEEKMQVIIIKYMAKEEGLIQKHFPQEAKEQSSNPL